MTLHLSPQFKYTIFHLFTCIVKFFFFLTELFPLMFDISSSHYDRQETREQKG